MEISLYTASRWGIDQAAAYALQIDAQLAKLANQSVPGVDRANLYRGLRKAICGNHHVYFLIDKSEIEVIRILHPAMDVHEALSDLG